jgi:moderate conductance mechanosensitive channel
MAAADPGYLYDLLRKLGLTDFGARTGEFLLVRPVKVLLIVAIAALVSRLATRWIRGSIRSLQLRAPLLAGTARSEQRAATIAEVLGSLVRVVVWSVAVLIVFDQLGINLAPLLAGAGIAGIAIGFGAQSLVKDVISGLFILVEDQYGVGDAVDLGDVAGAVEDVNLRVTRLRAADGRVWFVPNGEIRRVGNGSLGWSCAMVDVVLPRTAEVAATLDAAAREVSALAGDDRWAGRILEPPEVLGVEALTVDAMTVRVSVKTPPQQQAAVARAIRTRLASLPSLGSAAPG